MNVYTLTCVQVCACVQYIHMVINNTSTYACTPACMYIHYACMCVVYISTSACMLVCGDTRCPSAPALLSLQMGARASDQQWSLLLRSMAATTSQQTPSQLIGWPHSVMYVHIHAICHHAHLPLHLCTCPPPPTHLHTPTHPLPQDHNAHIVSIWDTRHFSRPLFSLSRHPGNLLQLEWSTARSSCLGVLTSEVPFLRFIDIPSGTEESFNSELYSDDSIMNSLRIRSCFLAEKGVWTRVWCASIQWRQAEVILWFWSSLLCTRFHSQCHSEYELASEM